MPLNISAHLHNTREGKTLSQKHYWTINDRQIRFSFYCFIPSLISQHDCETRLVPPPTYCFVVPWIMQFVAGFSPCRPQFFPHLQTLKDETKLQLADELGSVRQRSRKTQGLTLHSGVQDFHAKFFPPFAEMATVPWI